MKKTIAIVMILILTITFMFGVISYAGIEEEAENIQAQIISLIKQIGISVMIVIIAIIGFSMLFGGGGDIAKYKIHFLILLLGAILMFKADVIGEWINSMLT